jgi:hypothetical protein
MWISCYRPSLFYIGLNPRWQMYKFLPNNLNVMYSAAGFYNPNDSDIWRKGAKFKKSFGLKFLDSGGYLMLMRYGHYPFSVVNYANLVARLRPHYYATMDFACEPDLVDAKKTILKTVKERIEATVENALKLSEWENQLPGQMVPVIQGYSLDEYLFCLDLYNQAGLIRDYMAIGSMCRRISKDQLAILIPSIYHYAQKLGVSRLHFFGLKLSSDLEPYREFIYSRDSAAIFYGNRTWNGRRFPRGQKEKQEAFSDFINKLKEMEFSYVSNNIPGGYYSC